jgi:glycosyltransferase involved in cell wall biosynthesis
MIENKKNIMFYKSISEKTKKRLYKESDIALIPIHSDGLGVYVEAIENFLYIVTFKSVHSSDFIINGNGIEIDVPFSYYDVDKYGTKWKTMNEFRKYLITSKEGGEFNNTIKDLTRTISEINSLDSSELKKMKETTSEALNTTFHYTFRNKKLIELYNSEN